MHKMKYTSNLPCYLDGSLGDKSRVFINNLSTFSEKDQTSFPWRRHCAVSGCGQRINVPSVKANVCWGFGSELRGDHVLETAGDTLTVRCSRQQLLSSSAALDFFPEKPNQRTAARMEKWKHCSCQLSWTTWSWSLAVERQEEESLEADFCPKHSVWRCRRILFGWVQLQDISII